MTVTENETTELLRKTQSGARTAINSIKEVLDDVESAALRDELVNYLNKHEYIDNEIEAILNKSGQEGKDPSVMARMMSWMKINVRMLESPKDKTVAKLMLEGCNMGISQLSGYLNNDRNADARSRENAERLLSTEEEMGVMLRKYL